MNINDEKFDLKLAEILADFTLILVRNGYYYLPTSEGVTAELRFSVDPATQSEHYIVFMMRYTNSQIIGFLNKNRDVKFTKKDIAALLIKHSIYVKQGFSIILKRSLLSKSIELWVSEVLNNLGKLIIICNDALEQ